jgi:hypothetical protein
MYDVQAAQDQCRADHGKARKEKSSLCGYKELEGDGRIRTDE